MEQGGGALRRVMVKWWSGAMPVPLGFGETSPQPSGGKHGVLSVKGELLFATMQCQSQLGVNESHYLLQKALESVLEAQPQKSLFKWFYWSK